MVRVLIQQVGRAAEPANSYRARLKILPLFRPLAKDVQGPSRIEYLTRRSQYKLQLQ
jgi:hypothetical protein